MDIFSRFQAFINEFLDENGDVLYLNEIKEMIREGKQSLLIDYEHLLSFDPPIAEHLLMYPELFLKQANRVLKTYIAELDPTHFERFQDRFYVRFYNVDSHANVSIREIRSHHLERLITIKGIVTKITEIRPLLRKAKFKCLRCGFSDIWMEQIEGRYTIPTECPNPECNRRGPFSLIKNESEFIDWQSITVQERPEELPPGQLPISLSCTALDDMVGLVRPGDRIKFTGILKTRQKSNLSRGQLATFFPYLDILSVEKETEEYETLNITPEDEEKIKELAKDPFIYEKIRNSIAPSIYGYDNIKKAIALLLFGGVAKTTTEGVKIRGESNILLVGDPGVGKSQLLRNVMTLAPRAIYTSGRGSSAAGLTAAVTRESETGEMTLEAGVLVLADKGIAVIDEFDKMRAEDRSAIHEAMEQHSYHPSTEITLADGTIVKIGELVERLFKIHRKNVIEGVHCEILPLEEDIHILTTDFKTIKSIRIDRVSRHEAPDHFFRITFSNGRSIIVTPEHPIYVYDFGITTRAASELKTGMIVPAPQKITYKQRPIVLKTDFKHDQKPISFPDVMTPELAAFLGYLATKGSVNERKNIIEFKLNVNSSKIVRHVENLIHKLFLIEPRTSYNAKQQQQVIRVISRSLLEYLKCNFPELMRKPSNKRIPRQIFSSHENIRIAFLKTAFSNKSAITPETYAYYTVSEKMADDFQELLLTLGIHSQILRKRTKSNKNRKKQKKYYLVSIKGSSVEKFTLKVMPTTHMETHSPKHRKHTMIRAKNKRKVKIRENLPPDVVTIIKECLKDLNLLNDEHLCQPIANDEYGITIETVKKYLKILKKRYHKLKNQFTQMKINPFKERIQYRYTSGQLSEIISEWTHNTVDYQENDEYWGEKSDQRFSNRKAEEYEQFLRNIRKKIAYLERLCRFEWVQVISIEKIPNSGKYKTKWVYDVTIEPTRNFISQGLVLHNTISIAKAGIVATLNSRTSVLAAANPRLGRWNEYKDLAQNINLPPTIISRFDLVFVLKDVPDIEEDTRKAAHILNLHASGGTVQTAAIDRQLLKKYIAYARQHIKPRLTPDAAARLQEFYIELRSRSTNLTEAGAVNPIAITPRQLESLVRLAEAHAKMALREEVTVEDANEAIRLMQAALEEIARDPETGEIDIDRASGGVSARSRSKVDRILEAVDRILDSTEDGTYDRAELIKKVAEELNLESREVEEVLENAERQGLYYRPGTTRIGKT